VIDLLVAGGGPVGLATALYAHRAGLSVVVAEPRRGTIDKACGEGLMPGAVGALRDLGVDLVGMPFRGIRYLDGDRSAEATFGARPGLGVRRTTLHSALRRAVDESGIETLVRPVTSVEQDGHRVCAAGVEARYLAAADGLHSPVRRLLGLEQRRTGQARYGIRRHYQVHPWTDLVEVHWARHCEAYVTPVGADLVGVAILTSRHASFEEQLRDFPALGARLPLTAASKARGAGPLRQSARARVHGRALLVGDAAGYVDALTGEGVSMGLASAAELVACVVADDPASYERRWLAATRRYRVMTGSLLWARDRRLLRGAIVPAAAALPAVFRTAVQALAGDSLHAAGK
jgi:2-polyprenyl-6-methoxyphenol hydroxylase-like FAD-dependent oxidoreductase